MKEIKAYLQNQKEIVTATMIALLKTESMNMVELNYLTSKFIFIDQMLKELENGKGKKTKK